MRRTERAMNDGTLADIVDEWYEPDFTRIDRRTVIGTGVMDIATYIENVPEFYGTITHTPLALRGDRFLLARATLAYEGGNESRLLVLAEVSEVGRERLIILFDEDAVDEAMLELDRRYARSLSDEERATLRVSGEFGEAFLDQDSDAYLRLVHPGFRAVEHGTLGSGELDRSTWEANHRDQVEVFGRGRLRVDVLQLMSPYVVLCRTVQTGTSESGVDWEITEWNVLQVADGQVIRDEVFEDDPGNQAAVRARRRAEELVAQARHGPGENRAVDAARAVVTAWETGVTAEHLLAERFERLDRRRVAPFPAADGEESLSSVLPVILEQWTHIGVDDVLLAYDDSFALVRLRAAPENDHAEFAVLNAVASDEDGRLTRAATFDPDQEEEARRELTLWWAPTLPPRRMEVSQLAVTFGEAWVAPTARPFGDMLSPDFTLLDGRTLGLGELDRAGFVRALVGREDDGTTGPPVPSRVEFVSDDVLVFRAANRGVTPGTEVEWEEIACNVFVTAGPRVRRVEMFDEDRWDDAVTRARAIVEEQLER
jgi:hypothetical protein